MWESSGISGSSFDPSSLAAGSYTVTYAYTDAFKCLASTVIVETPEACSGINEELLPGVLVYPNPNNGEFTLTGVEIGQCTFRTSEACKSSCRHLLYYNIE